MTEAQPRSPGATNVVLIVTVGVTAAAVFMMLRGPLSSQDAVPYLVLFTFLFLLRVLGQVYVLLGAPSWLPPVEGENWNLVPYRVLFPSQVAILAFMGFIIASVSRGLGPLGARNVMLGRGLIAASVVYAGVMMIRYVVRMTRRPDQRWFGGAIPIVYHQVLAAFLLAWGWYHVSR